MNPLLVPALCIAFAAVLAVWLALLPQGKKEKLLQIKTTGVEDYLDGSANIKALVIGGPGAGKTRMASYWPKPIYLDCENGRGSLADRAMPYAEIKTSRDMLDALEYLKGLERTAKISRQFQTVVVDTADSFQRLVKDEWVRDTKAGSFTGYDAWGYLDTKMQLLFTRLLNLDYNVVVLVHYTSKEHKDGDNTVREFALQLQGAVKDQIFNDFGLVGWLGTYWTSGENGRVQKRGLTFEATPDKPFLKDRFNATPKWMEINFSDNDYQQLFEAFYNRPEFENLGQGDVVGEIPDANDVARQAPEGVTRPQEGGPLPPRPPAEVPLEKKLKGELEDIAKELGVPFKGNTLKGELIDAIKAEQQKRIDEVKNPRAGDAPITKGTDVDLAEPVRHEDEKPVAEGGHTPQPKERPDPTSEQSSTGSNQGTADAAAASSEDSANSAASSAPSEDAPLPVGGDDGAKAEEVIRDQLGGEVISREPADNSQAEEPASPAKRPSAPTACADCGGDLAGEMSDPKKRDYLRLSKAKHKRYLCSTCHDKASGK